MKLVKYHLLFILLVGLNTVRAQEKRPPSPEEMHLKKWEYLVKTAQLSDKEGEIVKPIFMQYENDVWELHKKSRPMRKDKITQPNYEELNEKYIEREIRQAELLKEYHSKLKKVLSPEVLHNYYRAEGLFKRNLIYEMRNNHQKQRQGAPQDDKK